MPVNFEDPWFKGQEVSYNVSELQECAIAVDASYFLRQLLEQAENYNEPLLTALGGLTGIQARIQVELDNWLRNRTTPFFIFDGQPMVGQDKVTTKQGREIQKQTGVAWKLYSEGQAEAAVAAFGECANLYNIQALYPMLQAELRLRKLHFLVAPFNAAAQIAYLDMIDSDQCGGIMGPLELMLYPIQDCVIRSIDWVSNTCAAISKKNVMKVLNVSEPHFIDAFLMTGTPFLPPFPPLTDSTLVKSQPYNIVDAINMLRTADKSVTMVSTTFHDLIKNQDPTWLDKYRKAWMAVKHFVYIAESGEVKVHDADHLTNDNHEYLGLQIPWEMFHYLSTGLIGPRLLSWITHSQVYVLPTLDGSATEEYKKLVSSQLVPLEETALSLVLARLHRGIVYKDIKAKVWYDDNYSATVLDHRHEARTKTNYGVQMATWGVIKEADIKQHFPGFEHGSIFSEVHALTKPDFVKLTFAKQENKLRNVESASVIKSICLWRYLHVRGYIDDQHNLTNWGKALDRAMVTLEPVVKKFPTVPYLYESVLVAMEMVRFGLLNGSLKVVEPLSLPMHGDDDDKSSLMLISRCATLLKLRHQANGYTGPLSKNLLTFHSLAGEVRSAERALMEAILASLFLYGQGQRKRDDSWELSHQLPFLFNPDVALGIAVKTYFDETINWNSEKEKAERLATFPDAFVPYSMAFSEDLEIACEFFEAVYAGLQTLDGQGISANDLKAWSKANEYLSPRTLKDASGN
ncbi:temperature dependent protein affecting M2 dsRNA replication-domain-containing protein [Pseudoneurospora amorphoporcata]|uniref:Temperature dependent protein affecting M2 dsRNA replication-domain-containing protein n=1 Tax=Pseudoneurospora amorphoporcata TaxID=241081 RepID=A0AAN6P2K2_9PEZI|nr:temperature dependent protein affecting M2 dsRNA replication-domain-containing protein [Pseudoneurospora amorphoporcata]